MMFGLFGRQSDVDRNPELKDQKSRGFFRNAAQKARVRSQHQYWLR